MTPSQIMTALMTFQPGTRVELHPGTDRWMMGDRYGDVIKQTKRCVHVKLDKSGKLFRVAPGLLKRI